MPSYLIINKPTTLKRSPAQSSTLPAKELYQITGGDLVGRKLPLAAQIEDIESNHIKFTLKDAQLGGMNTWWVYGEHAVVEEDEPRLPEADKVMSFNPEFKERDRGTAFKVPGISATLFSNDPVGRAKNILWYELTHRMTRLPKTEKQTAALIRIAEAAQEARDKIGKPFLITSGFRPEPFNSRAGGARGSRHLIGDAIDFKVEGWSTLDLFKAFDGWWQHGLGKYKGLSICHLDARGYRARWYH